MTIFYSASTAGFYSSEINENMPEDVKEVTQKKYDSLLEGQSLGKVIVSDNDGNPILEEAPKPSIEILKELRKQGYQNISDPIFMQWQRGLKTQQEWLDAVAQVEADYPITEENA